MVKKCKQVASVLLAGAMVLGLAGCGGSSTAPASTATSSANAETSQATQSGDNTQADSGNKVGEKVFKLSFNQSIENPEAVTLQEMSDALYDATEGRYSIEVFPNEQLGSQQESLEFVQAGTIDMALVANSLVENVNPDFAIIGTPYIYDSEDHQQKFFESDAVDELFKTTESSGFTCLAAYSLGARCVYSTKPVTTPEELSGMKIRVMQSDTMIKMMDLLGGVGTPMSQGDVYTAIQSGTINGAENNIITYVDLLQYEVAPHYSLTKHLMIPDELIINTDLLNSMSPEDQEALKKVAKESVTTAFNKCKELRAGYFDKAEKELGVTVTEVDIAPFQEKCKPLIEEIANRSDMTKKIYEAILSVR